MKKIILKEEQLHLLNESYVGELYHFTNLEGIYGILKDNCINVVLTDDEEVVCLSRTGNPYLGYCPNSESGLIFRITLDADKMMSSIRGMKIKPWSNNNERTIKGFDGRYISVSDYEERAYENIEPLDRYCKSIDVFPIIKDDELDNKQINTIEKLIKDFPEWGKYFRFY